jgi:hypothetical protein
LSRFSIWKIEKGQSLQKYNICVEGLFLKQKAVPKLGKRRYNVDRFKSVETLKQLNLIRIL